MENMENKEVIVGEKAVDHPIVEKTKPEKPKKPHGNKGRKMSESQRAGLDRGLAILKAKREEIAKEKALKKESKTSVKTLDVPALKDAIVKSVAIENPFNSDDFRQLRELLTREKNPEKIVEKIVEKEVPKEVIVHKEKVVSGSELLNKIFFSR